MVADSKEQRTADGIRPGQLYIDGVFRDAADGKRRPTLNPATEEAITEVAEAGPADVEAAVQAAHRAFEQGDWVKMAPHDRSRLLFRVAQLVEARADDLARREALDMGKPVTFARAVDTRLLVDLFTYYAGVAVQLGGSTRPATPPAPGALGPLAYTRREPLGVVAAITPFNFPMLLAASKIAPALAAGNTVVHKPATATPLSAVAMAEILHEAGVPRGVFNLVTGPGSMVGNILVRHPAVKKVAFTGSTAVGKQIARDAVDSLKKVTLELGGKSAHIVFADADLDVATQHALFGVYYNKGEVCTAGSRLLVERSVHDELVERLKLAIGTLRIGDPLDPATTYGPQVDQHQLQTCIEYTRIGFEEGAKLVAGGGRLRPESTGGKGHFFAPTLFTGVRNEMRIAQEEIFGPILSVIPFDSEDEAIRIANDSPYGLAAGIQTSDLKRAHRVAHRLEAGIVWVNTYNQFDIAVPFGGYKASGLGRELGTEVMEAYTQTKSVWVDLS